MKRFQPFHLKHHSEPEFAKVPDSLDLATVIQYLSDCGRFPCGYINENRDWFLFQTRRALVELGSVEGSIEEGLAEGRMWSCTLFPATSTSRDVRSNLAEIPADLFKLLMVARGTLHVDGRPRIDGWVPLDIGGQDASGYHLLSEIQPLCHQMTIQCSLDGMVQCDLQVVSTTGHLLYGCLEGMVPDKQSMREEYKW